MNEKTTERIALCPKCDGRRKYADIDYRHSTGREIFYLAKNCDACNGMGVVLETTTIKQSVLTQEEFDNLPISGKKFTEYKDLI